MRCLNVFISMSVLGLAFACSNSLSEGEDQGTSGSSGNGSSGSGSSAASGSGGVIAAGGSSGGAGIGVGGSINVGQGGSSGTGGGGTGTFDGGHRPITPEEEDVIDDASCDGWSFEPELLPAALELVVDVSSSMSEPAPGSMQTKWEATRDALLDAVVGDEMGGGLPATLSVGLLFYPNRMVRVETTTQDVTACVRTDASVPIQVLGGPTEAHRVLLRDSMAQATLNSSTPTHDAYRYALESVIGPSTVSANKYILLITDGEPTLSAGCMNPSGTLQAVDPEPIVNEITTAAAQNIKTFLIGSPGSENNRAWMSRAAVIGGTALPGCQEAGPNWCHMDMTTAPDFSAALNDGLAAISGAISPCAIEIPTEGPNGQPIDTNKINVFVNTPGQATTLIIRDDIGDCTEGWKVDGTRVSLCAASCEMVQNDPTVTVNVRFGCGSLPTDPE